MSPVVTVAAATLRRSIRSRSFFVLGFAAPVLIMAALSATVGSALAGEFRPTLVIVDPTGGPMTQGFVGSIGDAGFDDTTVLSNAELALTAVENGTADAAIIMPSEPFGSSSDVSIRVVTDGESQVAAATAEAIAAQFATSAASSRALAIIGADLTVAPGPITVASASDVGSSVLTDGTYFAVGMSSFFTTFAAVGFMAGYHQERRQSTLGRMLTAPIGRLAPITGMAFGVLAVAAVSMLTLIVASTLLLGADWGPLFGVIAIGSALVFSAVCVATCVVALTSTETSAIQVGTILATGWAVFGGVFVEIPTSGPLATGARLSPFSWALDGIGLNAGTGTSAEVIGHAAAIAVFGLVALGITASRRARLVRP